MRALPALLAVAACAGNPTTNAVHGSDVHAPDVHPADVPDVHAADVHAADAKPDVHAADVHAADTKPDVHPSDVHGPDVHTAATKPDVLITDPAALAAIEAAGGAFASLTDAKDRATIFATTRDDVAAAGRGDPAAGVGIARHDHRLFDVGWLDHGTFSLIGVAYRIDRLPLTPTTCGDIRLVYRLGYRTKTAGVDVASRLPMTIAIVLDGPARVASSGTADARTSGTSGTADARTPDARMPDARTSGTTDARTSGTPDARTSGTADARTSGTADARTSGTADARTAGCRDAARAWRLPAGLAGDALGKALVAGPLVDRLARDRVHLVLSDTQVVRWPSAARPDLAGHAEYALRQFRRDATALVVDTVDQTPDVAAIKRDPRKRAQLLAWLRDPATLDALALGYARLPATLSATKALSVSPRGLARRANRPFRQLLSPADVADISLANRANLGSPEALLRRLDDHTCAGCHQSQTIAGFHLLGEDGPDVAPGNALAVSLSSPLLAERARRAALLDALANGSPAPDLARPPTERTGNPGARGAHCGLGDPGFAAWTCDAGLTCQPADAPHDDAAIGECQPPPAEARAVGDPCELGPLAANADPRRDSGPSRPPTLACANGGVCDENRVGFPGGMCTNACGALAAGDGGTCGVIAQLTPFNNCLAQGRPFPACLAAHVSPAAVRRCDETHACRDDYVCTREPNGDGGCTPPYFLFQLRVDGHPSSASSK